MLKKIFTAALLLGAFALHAEPAAFKDASSSAKGLKRFAVFANQSQINSSTTQNIPWDSFNQLNSPQIFTDGLGHITIQKPGIYFVQYTVRVTEFDGALGSFTTIAQLQQTVNGVPTNIPQHAVTTTSHVVATADANSFQTQITGWALIKVTSRNNNVINVLVTTSAEDEILAATGSDANAELLILQVNS